jgi:histidine ammonia-lyase
MGYGRAQVGGRSMTAKAALKKIGEEPMVLHAKEGLALVNGTEIMKAVGVLVCERAIALSKLADAIGSLSIEALFGSAAPFDERLAELNRLRFRAIESLPEENKKSDKDDGGDRDE